MSPEVVGALWGIGGTAVLGIIPYAIKGIIRNGGNGKVNYCVDHYKIVEHIAEVKTDVKWIRKQIEHNMDNNMVANG
jgi:hypothetical protein